MLGGLGLQGVTVAGVLPAQLGSSKRHSRMVPAQRVAVAIIRTA